jgi:hypothetical protein
MVLMSATNLQVIKRSRHEPRAGELFAMQLPGGAFLFGRVIVSDPPRSEAPMPESYLIYVYRHQSASTSPDWKALRPEELLLPPVWINQLPWTKGYFHTVDERPLAKSDLLDQHCFREFTGRFLDERGRPLRIPVEPCGDWGLASYRWLDDQVSDSLGIPRVPDDGKA